MRSSGISQVPVMDADGVRGIVTEADVLMRLIEHPGASDDPISDIAEQSYSVVDPHTTVAVLSDMFTKVKMALVMEGKEIVNVVTKIDLIEYLSKATA